MQPTLPEWLKDIRQAEQFFDQKRFDEAAELAARALKRNPNAALAHQVLALVHVERLQFREAIPRLEQTLALRPDLAPSHNGLAQCWMHLDDLDRAEQALNTALCLDPQHAFAHFNRALLWLKQGRFREGWVEYEWRFAAGLVQRPDLPRPRWDGSALENRSILIHTEQGLGDVLQFVRLLPLIRRRAQRLVFACQKPLHAFLSSLSCIDEFLPVDEPGDVTFDVCCALLTLPALLQLDGSDYHASVPYVYPDPARVQSWGERLRPFSGFKIGLNWQGNPTFHGDKFRSIPLRYFAPLAQVPGVRLFSVQKGPGLDQVATNWEQVPMTVFDDLASDGTLHDTAALMQHLDLVITSDTAVAHLAGALGRPTWVLLARNSDWRWLIDRPDSPWYPTMRPLSPVDAGRLDHGVRARGGGPSATAQCQSSEHRGHLLKYFLPVAQRSLTKEPHRRRSPGRVGAVDEPSGNPRVGRQQYPHTGRPIAPARCERSRYPGGDHQVEVLHDGGPIEEDAVAVQLGQRGQRHRGPVRLHLFEAGAVLQAHQRHAGDRRQRGKVPEGDRTVAIDPKQRIALPADAYLEPRQVADRPAPGFDPLRLGEQVGNRARKRAFVEVQEGRHTHQGGENIEVDLVGLVHRKPVVDAAERLQERLQGMLAGDHQPAGAAAEDRQEAGEVKDVAEALFGVDEQRAVLERAAVPQRPADLLPLHDPGHKPPFVFDPAFAELAAFQPRDRAVVVGQHVPRLQAQGGVEVHQRAPVVVAQQHLAAVTEAVVRCRQVRPQRQRLVQPIHPFRDFKAIDMDQAEQLVGHGCLGIAIQHAPRQRLRFVELLLLEETIRFLDVAEPFEHNRARPLTRRALPTGVSLRPPVADAPGSPGQ